MIPPPMSPAGFGCSIIVTIAAMLCFTALLALHCRLDHEREMERIRQGSRP